MVGKETPKRNIHYICISFQDNTEEHKLIGKEVKNQKVSLYGYGCAARKAGKPSQALS